MGRFRSRWALPCSVGCGMAVELRERRRAPGGTGGARNGANFGNTLATALATALAVAIAVIVIVVLGIAALDRGGRSLPRPHPWTAPRRVRELPDERANPLAAPVSAQDSLGLTLLVRHEELDCGCCADNHRSERHGLESDRLGRANFQHHDIWGTMPPSRFDSLFTSKSEPP